jgi:hypothetical protein
MSIVLHIERLVIDEALMQGKRPAALQATIENELARQLAQPGAVDVLRGIGAVTALPLTELPASTRPQDGLGERVAAAVQQRLGIPPVAASVPRGRTVGGSQRG